MLKRLLFASCAAFLVPAAFDSVHSQQGWWTDRPAAAGAARRARTVRQSIKKPRQTAAPARAPAAPKAQAGAAPAPPDSPLLIVVSIGRQRISVYSRNGLVASGGVSTGRVGFPTPTGAFTILQKNRYHRSNIYSNAPMPYMQRITWSGVALHQGVLPGYPASHGCIRLSQDFATRLWTMTKMGARVMVTRGDIVPAPVSHSQLFVPKLQALPVAELQAAAAAGEHSSPVGYLNPIAFAEAAKSRAVKAEVAAAETFKDALAASREKSTEANKASAALREAEAVVAAAEAKVVAATARAAQEAKTEEAVQAAKAAKEAAENVRDEAVRKLKDAKATDAVRSAEAFAAARAAREAEAAGEATSDAVREFSRRTRPVSIFISRKAQRLFVRQNHRPVLEVPVTIAEPDAPMGTHVFTAMGPAPDGRTMQWHVASFPGAPPPSDPPRGRGKKSTADETPSVRPNVAAAAAALDRITIPADVAERISALLWTGASLIVSDLGMGNEMGQHTDFIIQTSH